MNNQSPQYPATLHDLLLQFVESTPQSSSLRQRWSTLLSGIWQALSSLSSSVVAGHTCNDIALDCLNGLPPRCKTQVRTQGLIIQRNKNEDKEALK